MSAVNNVWVGGVTSKGLTQTVPMIVIKGIEILPWPRVNKTSLPLVSLSSPSKPGKCPRDSKLFELEVLSLKFGAG